MKRFAGMIFVVVGFLLAVQTIAAQEWSQPWARERIAQSPRHSEWVTVKHDGRNVETLIVYPESKDKRPVVLVIHEIFGLSDWAQELADEVAAAGYIAVARFPQDRYGDDPHKYEGFRGAQLSFAGVFSLRGSSRYHRERIANYRTKPRNQRRLKTPPQCPG